MAYRRLKKLSLIAIIWILAACATAPLKPNVYPQKGDYGYLKEYMSWFIQKEMKDNDIVGLSIALVDDQSIIWAQGFGYADHKNKIEATPDTLYRAGSISKLFNGMAAMKLVEVGKMDIDRPLVTYLPEFKIRSRFGSTDGITPRTIMTHHSGLPGDWIDGMYGEQPLPFTQLVHLIKDEYVAYAPDTVLSYSNLGVTLLGHAVQNVSGQSYSEFIDQVLLTPMGMKNSRFETGLTGSRSAKSYDKGKEVVESPMGDIPAGGLNTSILDLSRLAILVNNNGELDNRQILSPESLKAMFAVQNDPIALDLGHKVGLAWFIDDNLLARKEPVYQHGGAMVAHRAWFMAAPESKIGVVVLANTSSADTYKISKKLLQMAWETKNGEALPPKTTRSNKTVDRNKASDFKGTFATLIGKVDVTEKSTNQYKVNSSLGKFNLNREKDEQYHLSYRLFGFIPIDLEELGEAGLTTETISGHHVIVAELDQDRYLAGVKVEPYPVPSSWKDRLGPYKLLNPPDSDVFPLESFELKMEGGFLVEAMTFSGDRLTQILRPVNSNEAVIEGLGRSFRETVRIIADDAGGEILTFSGLRFKRFEKEP